MKKNLLICIGIIIYIILTVIDKFIYKIPSLVYIPLAIIGLLCIIIGCILDRKK